MQGIELSEKFYTQVGLPLLQEKFASLLPRFAFGLVGEGSECFGYDDALSEDHDFVPGFSIYLPNDLPEAECFQIEKAYRQLPKAFLGYRRDVLDPVGGSRQGPIKVRDFYLQHIGWPALPPTLKDWLALSESELATATNGKVFADSEGVFSQIRQGLLQLPEDVRLKKLAAHLLFMAQSGPYNYARCLAHGEPGAAQLALAEFVRHALCVAHLLEGRYCPYYKWAFRSLREGRFAGMEEPFLFLLSEENTAQNAAVKTEVLDDLARILIQELTEQALIARPDAAASCDLESAARKVQATIRDAELRQMHIMAGV